MARYVPGTYKNGRAARIILRVVLILAAVLLLLLVFLFFYLRRYIEYTRDGTLRLVIPGL